MTNLKKLKLGNFRKLYEFFKEKFGKMYSVSMEYDGNKGSFVNIGTPCIEITEDDLRSRIKIFDPAYYAPSSNNSVIVEIIMHDQDYEPAIKTILLSRFDEQEFGTIAEKILKCVLIAVDEDDEETATVQRQVNKKIVEQFGIWSIAL